MPSQKITDLLKKGVVIPASPLALDEKKRIDTASQKVIYRYYIDAGARGIAVGVHSTQFEIRDPEFRLFEPLLKLALEEMKSIEERTNQPVIKIAGVCGKTSQAAREAEFAASVGYDMALLSLASFREESEDEIIAHCKEIAGIIPIMGFYLQTSIGGRMLPYSFWRKFVEIENVLAIKVAAFNRYQTIDVVRALLDSGMEDRVSLYTGNDDNIILDLLTPYGMKVNGAWKMIHFRGGLLGQWSVWTKRAVEILEQIKELRSSGKDISPEWLTRNAQYTEANAAVFDAAHEFRGCISGINEVLRQQGLIRYSHCLREDEKLSGGQLEEIRRVRESYSWLIDDDFVRENLSKWRNC